MPSTSEIINYFVNKKFGLIGVFASGLEQFQKNRDPNAPKDKQLIEIENYKTYLSGLDPAELEKSYKAALLQDAQQAKLRAIEEEKQRFYNLPNAQADFNHWAKAAYWTLDEAIALSLYKDPKIVNWKNIEPIKSKSEFTKSYAKRIDLIIRLPNAKGTQSLVSPMEFVNWAKKIELAIPEKLISEVERINRDNINWQAEYEKLKQSHDVLLSEIDSLKAFTQKSESTRKSNNILQAFTAIAIDAYGYDPKAEKSTAPQDISDALDKIGAKGSPKTIRTWLKEGAVLLPAKPDKT